MGDTEYKMGSDDASDHGILARIGQERQWNTALLLLGVILFVAAELTYSGLALDEHSDNVRYKYSFVEIARMSFGEAFDSYQNDILGPQAAEPGFFAVFFIATRVTDWRTFVLLKNAILILGLALCIGGYVPVEKRTLPTLFILALVLFTDFYLTRMALIIHRLGLAVGVFCWVMIVLRRHRVAIAVGVSTLFHFQMVVLSGLLPLDKYVSRLRREPKLLLLSVILAAAIALGLLTTDITETLWNKLRWYWDRDPLLTWSNLRVPLLAAVYMFVVSKVGGRNLETHAIHLAFVLAAGIVVGFSRLLFLVYWGAMFSVLVASRQTGKQILFLSPFILYNLLRTIIYVSRYS